MVQPFPKQDLFWAYRKGTKGDESRQAAAGPYLTEQAAMDGVGMTLDQQSNGTEWGLLRVQADVIRQVKPAVGGSGANPGQ